MRLTLDVSETRDDNATLSVDNQEVQSAYDEAIIQVKAGWLGVEVPMFIEKAYADKLKAIAPPTPTYIFADES